MDALERKKLQGDISEMAKSARANVSFAGGYLAIDGLEAEATRLLEIVATQQEVIGNFQNGERHALKAEKANVRYYMRENQELRAELAKLKGE
jgi:predicted phage gp36 major capsid-like protein